MNKVLPLFAGSAFCFAFVEKGLMSTWTAFLLSRVSS